MEKLIRNLGSPYNLVVVYGQYLCLHLDTLDKAIFHTKKSYLKIEVFYAALDKLLLQLNERFHIVETDSNLF